MALWNVDSL